MCLKRASCRVLYPIVVAALLSAGCGGNGTEAGTPDTMPAVSGTWVLARVDTQTSAPFVTHYVCSPSSGVRYVTEILAESLIFDSARGARRRFLSRMSSYQDSVLREPPVHYDVHSVGTYQATEAPVSGPMGPALLLYLDPAPGSSGASYSMLLQRTDSTLEKPVPMQNNCGLPLASGDRLGAYTRVSQSP